MSKSVGAPWLVLRVKSRQEQVVETHLNTKQIETFLPKRFEFRNWNDRSKFVETVLFPGYIFVRPQPTQFEAIKYARGSCGLLVSAGRCAHVSEQDVDAIKIMVRSGLAIKVEPRLVQGQPVEVIAGPFSHARGEFVREKGEHRLVINAHLIGRSVSVEMNASDVRPVESDILRARPMTATTPHGKHHELATSPQ